MVSGVDSRSIAPQDGWAPLRYLRWARGATGSVVCGRKDGVWVPSVVMEAPGTLTGIRASFWKQAFGTRRKGSRPGSDWLGHLGTPAGNVCMGTGRLRWMEEERTPKVEGGFGRNGALLGLLPVLRKARPFGRSLGLKAHRCTFLSPAEGREMKVTQSWMRL